MLFHVYQNLIEQREFVKTCCAVLLLRNVKIIYIVFRMLCEITFLKKDNIIDNEIIPTCYVLENFLKVYNKHAICKKETLCTEI